MIAWIKSNPRVPGVGIFNELSQEKGVTAPDFDDPTVANAAFIEEVFDQ
jgi:hypothetical protein